MVIIINMLITQYIPAPSAKIKNKFIRDLNMLSNFKKKFLKNDNSFK
jgi:hypothetical protein